MSKIEGLEVDEPLLPAGEFAAGEFAAGAFAAGAFAPCAEFRALHHEEPCDTCGWLAADHEPGESLAVVIAVPSRHARPLRRAS